MNDRAFNVAAMARRFALLSERPELLYAEGPERIERVLSDDTKAPLDVMLLGGVDEGDRVCAAAVVALRGDAPQAKPILSLLSVLPAERLLGIYHALPRDRRRQCEADSVWAYQLRHAPDGVDEAQAVLRELAELDVVDMPEQMLEAGEASDFRRFTDTLLRCHLGADVMELAGEIEQVLGEMGYGD